MLSIRQIKLLKLCQQYKGFQTALAMSERHSTSKAVTEANSDDIQHDPKNLLFELSIPGCNDKGYVSYEHIDKSTLDLQHTFVPESMRGQGIAKKLAKYAFDYVSEQNLKMKLSCWYLQKYLKENPNPEYAFRVVEDS